MVMWQNAAELDRYLTAEKAFNDAITAGKTEDDAKAAAVAAVRKKREEQLLRSLGVEL